MNDIGLDPPSTQPARKPEAIAARFEANNDALDLAAGFHRFVPPAIKQFDQSLRIRHERLQGIARDAWNDRANQPLVAAEFHHGYESEKSARCAKGRYPCRGSAPASGKK